METEANLVINGSVLKAARIAQNQDLGELSKLLCLSIAQLRQIEDGGERSFYHTQHKLHYTKRYASILGVPLAEVVPGMSEADAGDATADAGFGPVPPAPEAAEAAADALPEDHTPTLMQRLRASVVRVARSRQVRRAAIVALGAALAVGLAAAAVEAYRASVRLASDARVAALAASQQTERAALQARIDSLQTQLEASRVDGWIRQFSARRENENDVSYTLWLATPAGATNTPVQVVVRGVDRIDPVLPEADIAQAATRFKAIKHEVGLASGSETLRGQVGSKAANYLIATVSPADKSGRTEVRIIPIGDIKK